MGSSSQLYVVKGSMSGTTMFLPNKNSQRCRFSLLYLFTVIGSLDIQHCGSVSGVYSGRPRLQECS